MAPVSTAAGPEIVIWTNTNPPCAGRWGDALRKSPSACGSEPGPVCGCMLRSLTGAATRMAGLATGPVGKTGLGTGAARHPAPVTALARHPCRHGAQHDLGWLPAGFLL